MTHLIDKAALVAEIEKELNTTKKYSTEYVNGKKYALKKILSFLDTLEAKEVGVDFGDPQGDIGLKWVQEEPVSNDLEEAANNHPSAINTIAPQWSSEIKNAFKAGAKWQKEQMMKDAFDAEYWDGSVFRNDLREIYKDGDNVKVIIIKEE